MSTRPVRGAIAPTKAEGTPAPARAPRGAKTAEPVSKAPAKGKAATKKKEELPTSGKTVKKFLLVEKVKDYLAEVNPDLPAKIFDIAEKEVQVEGVKGKVCFVTFSEDKTVINDEQNKEAMLEILWHYHTQPWKGRGKSMVVEVLPADTENADIIVFQELND